ncbi:hypothetical protein [Deinococcus koreensis]|uniref:Cupin n=1 Tax=Deinococcus koreensis TaxID=2054903 RepID=A0A2K3UW36_9DEIO|nr:hypothetical protein [Deinococcus koreensis]PNY80742.1 hypothetical protein CVO96_04605 [Deinococcus koreensis]
MRRRTLLQLMLLDLASTLNPAGAAGPGLFHPDLGAEVSGFAPAAQTVFPPIDLTVEPGGWVPLGMAPVDRWIEVRAGEVLVVFRGERLVIPAGEIQPLPAGTALGLLNTGTDPAQVRITSTAPVDMALPPD